MIMLLTVAAKGHRRMLYELHTSPCHRIMSE
jgi:hypothetical protein